jgi:anaerobic ribonucleoside-triphosphate reductase activating protein
MKYAGIIENDITDSDDGIAYSVWFQGCPFKCEGCHNPETWDFNAGKEIEFSELLAKIKDGLLKNGITRNLSFLGGEPLCPQNRKYVEDIIRAIKNDELYKEVKIYCWTGYSKENLITENDKTINYILDNIDVLVDGLFVLEKRNISLKLRGSTNQRVWIKKDGEFILSN